MPHTEKLTSAPPGRTYLEVQNEIQKAQKKLDELHAEEIATIKTLIKLKGELMESPENVTVKPGEVFNG